MDWLSTVRGRFGMTWKRWFIYATGGAAWGHLKIKTLNFAETALGIFGQAGASNFSKTKTGWVAGAGLEKMIARRWSVRTEYLHYQFHGVISGNAIFPNAATPNNGVNITTNKIAIDSFRLGLNYVIPL